MEGVAVKAEPVTVETVVAKLSSLLTLRDVPTVIGTLDMSIIIHEVDRSVHSLSDVSYQPLK